MPISALFSILIFLILLSAFFSSSETGMMSLNRYRLKNLVKSNHKGAILASDLLDRIDRLIGVILIGNNFVNILASSIATIIAIRLWGDAGVWLATLSLTLVILIFAEVTPKTLAAKYPEKIAFPAAYILRPLLYILYPFVWLVNALVNIFLKILGVNMNNGEQDHLSHEELRTVVHEGASIRQRDQSMLLRILDLEKVTVNDIMVPRNEIAGIDIEDDVNEIMEQVRTSQYTLLPVYKEDINNVIGMLHLRKVARLFTSSEDDITKSALMQETTEPYFVPASTPLHTQLSNFQKNKRRFGLVVNEYGDILGIVTLEDILEEIVGEFTTDMSSISKDILPQDDGSFYVDGSANIRDINRSLNFTLPIDGPKTLNGLIMEYLEDIPDANIGFTIKGYRMEILQLKGNVIKTAKILPVQQESSIE